MLKPSIGTAIAARERKRSLTIAIRFVRIGSGRAVNGRRAPIREYGVHYPRAVQGGWIMSQDASSINYRMGSVYSVVTAFLYATREQFSFPAARHLNTLQFV